MSSRVKVAMVFPALTMVTCLLAAGPSGSKTCSRRVTASSPNGGGASTVIDTVCLPVQFSASKVRQAARTFLSSAKFRSAAPAS